MKSGVNYGLSKSQIAAFEQCPKKLWLSAHKRDLAQFGQVSELRFAAGNDVGNIARTLTPGGVMVQGQPDLAAALQQTSALMAAGYRGPIYEGTFSYEGVLIQADILEPVGDYGWNIIEVKSSTGIKEHHISDLATQVWVLENCQVNILGASIRHIDNSFVLQEPQDYAGLLKDVPLESEIAPLVAARNELVMRARATLGNAEPMQKVGTHCNKPFSCEFQAYCGMNLPKIAEWPIDILPNTGRRISEEMAALGIFDLRDIPADALQNEQHQAIRTATINNVPYHDIDAVREATKDWGWPLHYLDFETIALPVPAWVGTRPYQQTPFQFSCHTEKVGGNVTHYSFLSIDTGDPRRLCAETLIDCLGEGGSIVAYNAGFERGCVRGLAEAFPDLAPSLLDIADRIVDLLPVTRANYYHRDQMGSWSIKKVLPTIAPELAYSDLEIGDGSAAQLAWLEAVSEQCRDERRLEIRAALEEYCKRDTWAMVVLLRRLLSKGET